ncbi:DUF4058 family protein [Scytonema sp. NUACC26]|uniref:DUF4058 family protein n=1 Tax=Scytonema sp. NUACC26 TaxID=3140176 RepID=UPI0038B4032F
MPLSLSDEELSVDLQLIVDGVCEQTLYNDLIDYSLPIPPPKLSQANQQWVKELLAPIRGANGASL